MENNPKRSSDPKSTIEFEGNKYPEWIKFWDWKKNWKFEIIKTMRKYDIISAATELPMLALFGWFIAFFLYKKGNEFFF